MRARIHGTIARVVQPALERTLCGRSSGLKSLAAGAEAQLEAGVEPRLGQSRRRRYRLEAQLAFGARPAVRPCRRGRDSPGREAGGSARIK